MRLIRAAPCSQLDRSLVTSGSSIRNPRTLATVLSAVRKTFGNAFWFSDDLKELAERAFSRSSRGRLDCRLWPRGLAPPGFLRLRPAPHSSRPGSDARPLRDAPTAPTSLPIFPGKPLQPIGRSASGKGGTETLFLQTVGGLWFMPGRGRPPPQSHRVPPTVGELTGNKCPSPCEVPLIQSVGGGAVVLRQDSGECASLPARIRLGLSA